MISRERFGCAPASRTPRSYELRSVATSPGLRQQSRGRHGTHDIFKEEWPLSTACDRIGPRARKAHFLRRLLQTFGRRQFSPRSGSIVSACCRYWPVFPNSTWRQVQPVCRSSRSFHAVWARGGVAGLRSQEVGSGQRPTKAVPDFKW